MVRYLGAVDREFYFPELGITMESPVPGSDPYPTWRCVGVSFSGALNLNPPEPRDGDTYFVDGTRFGLGGVAFEER